MMIKALSITALALITPTVGSADMLHPDDVADVRLLSGWRMENGNHMAALQVTLEPGWKTYWRAPGDGGIPPEFDWSGSRNMGVVDFHWPTPEVMDAGGMTTIGYRHELVLPFEVTPSDIGEDVTLDADLLLGICKDICVPVSRPLSADLSAAATEPDMAILRALDSRPDTVEEAGVASVSCTLSTLSDGMRVTASLDLPRVGPDEIVVFEIDDPWSGSLTRWAIGCRMARLRFMPTSFRPTANRSASPRRISVSPCSAADARSMFPAAIRWLRIRPHAAPGPNQ